MSPARPRDLRVLVVNAGSSSLKLRILDGADRRQASVDLGPPSAASRGEIVRRIQALGPVDAVGHRVVHGGQEFRGPVRIDDDVLRRLEALSDLAPLHQPAALETIAATRQALPQIPAVACFDTAFHADMPEAASTFALPLEWRRRWGLRRYGFHGLSHAYASRWASERMGDVDARIVTCHLGAGASLAAVAGGRSRDTTMGFTPLDGLVMATRPGSLDPGMVLWLGEHAGLSSLELAETFEHRSGLQALAGTSDMRAIVAGAAERRADCVLALDVYVHHVRAGIAAMAAAMAGVDALVFTGGVGQNAPEVRGRTAAGLAFLGIRLDTESNLADAGDREIGATGSAVRVWVLEAREDLEIARQVRDALAVAAA